MSELTAYFHNAIDFYVEDCASTGRTPQMAASGKLMLRIPPEVHGTALVVAQAAGVSLNQWATKVLDEAGQA